MPFLVAGVAVFALLELFWQAPSREILLLLRLPRVLNALWVGTLLGMSGAVFQNVLRNPLAEPYTLGFSASTAMGVLVGMALGLSLSGSVFLGIVSGVGGMLLLVRLARTSLELILAGVALNFFAGALLVTLQSVVEPFRVYAMVRWSMGNLATVGYVLPLVALGLTLVWAVWIYRQRHVLMLASLGEDPARSLGLDWEALIRRVVVFTGALLSLSVARVGPIGFVGLVVPHLVRLGGQRSMGALLLRSAFLGSLFLLFSDFVAHLPPREIPVGAITALVGTPIFVILLVRLAHQGGVS